MTCITVVPGTFVSNYTTRGHFVGSFSAKEARRYDAGACVARGYLQGVNVNERSAKRGYTGAIAVLAFSAKHGGTPVAAYRPPKNQGGEIRTGHSLRTAVMSQIRALFNPAHNEDTLYYAPAYNNVRTTDLSEFARAPEQ